MFSAIFISFVGAFYCTVFALKREMKFLWKMKWMKKNENLNFLLKKQVEGSRCENGIWCCANMFLLFRLVLLSEDPSSSKVSVSIIAMGAIKKLDVVNPTEPAPAWLASVIGNANITRETFQAVDWRPSLTQVGRNLWVFTVVWQKRQGFGVWMVN